MKIIKCIAEKIKEEIRDAEAYIDMAITWKKDEPDAAEVFAELSAEEMGHVDKLHAEVVDQIRVYREEHGEPPKGMMELYDHLHQKHLEEAMKIKIKQNMLKG